QLGIPLDHQIIGIVAHFSKKKGHKYLLKAFSQINNKKLTIVLCGEGKLEKKLKKLCVKLNINQRVIFVGFQKDIYNMYKLFNILILPSIKGEGLPLSVLEAMSMGIPVIASSISGLKEIIDDGINGYLVPPKNIEYLKDKINYLINDKSLQNTFGTNGKYKITSQFTIQNNALRILQIYNKILSVYIKINV
ncbi:MAG: glycosyltransferase family 4 protein, partial [Spirochaetota bacterium]|nr:glycosyltransferase family 4 protein [Spirochaetota bacterium]